MGAWGHLNFENDTALDFVAEKSQQAIDRIKNNSELKELWEEAGEDFEEWNKVLDDLNTRISS